MIRDWPTGVNYFPEKGSFKFVPAKTTVRTNFDSGRARKRRRVTRNIPQITFSIIFKKEELEDFQTFYHSTLEEGSLWFRMKIYIRGQYLDHVVRFVDEYEFSDFGVTGASISILLEVRNFNAGDDGLNYVLQNYGENFIKQDFGNPLNKIVNEDYPKSMKDY